MRRFLSLLLLLALSIPALASDDHAEVRARLSERLPGVAAEDLRPTPIPGVYEVTLGLSVAYVSLDGRYLLRGSIVDLNDHENLTDRRRDELRAAWVAGLDESTMIVFDPPGEVRETLTVFTDIECGYCRRFHADIDVMLRSGLRVRYLFYAALSQASVEKAHAVWCMADRQDALTRAKAGRNIGRSPAACAPAPLDAHMALGREVGVRGTPAMVTASGRYLGGYLPVERMLQELGL